MLAVRLEGCGASKEVGQLPQLQIKGNVLTSSDYGEIARYGQGYWFAGGSHFISVLVGPCCFVQFQHHGNGRSQVYGPYRMVRSSGGSIWVTELGERLLAKWHDAQRQWQCVLEPGRGWPDVSIAGTSYEQPGSER